MHDPLAQGDAVPGTFTHRHIMTLHIPAVNAGLLHRHLHYILHLQSILGYHCCKIVNNYTGVGQSFMYGLSSLDATVTVDYSFYFQSEDIKISFKTALILYRMHPTNLDVCLVLWL